MNNDRDTERGKCCIDGRVATGDMWQQRFEHYKSLTDYDMTNESHPGCPY